MSTKKGKDRRHPSRTNSRAGWRTTAPRDKAAAQRTVLPSIVGTPVQTSLAGTPVSLVYTAPAQSMVVMEITTYGLLGQPVPVSGVTDTGGLTWYRRRQITFATTYTGGGTLATVCQQVTKEVWWAFTTVAQTSKTLNVALSNTANQETGSDLIVFCVQNVANPAAPWDDDASLEAVNTYPNGTPATATSVTVSGNTTQANSLVLAGLFEQLDSTNSVAATLNAGYTSIQTISRGTAPNTLHVQVASASQAASGAIANPYSSTKGNWIAWLDAISGTVGGGSARDTTAAPSGLALDGSAVTASDGTGKATSLTAALSTNYANDVLIAVVDLCNFAGGGGSGAIITSALSDNAGLNWQLRSRISAKANSGTFSQTQEVWWAVAPSPLINDQITATFTSFVSQASTLTVFAVSGSPQPSSPWDSNVSLPATNVHMSGVTAAVSQFGTTTATKSMLFGFMGYSRNGHADSTDPTGFTPLFDGTLANSVTVEHDYKLLSAAGAQTVTWGNSQDYFLVTVDALSGDVANSLTGTITTNLTKASFSAAGWAEAIGTVQTNLTKASQSLIGKESATGSIHTNLTKANLSTNGWAEILGSATTALSKMRIASLATTEVFTGTITTHLSKASFSGAGWAEAIGTETTGLSGIAQSVSGHEGVEVDGTIVTALTKASFSAAALEIITGQAVTALDPHGISISGSVLEIMTGTIVTRLGGENGAMIGNVVEAEEIIQGPIVMALSPFRPLILGAKLGTPGIGKWYSWRYTDSS